MWVGCLRVVLELFNNDNQRLKHSTLEELSKDLRRKYKLSALEVDHFDDPEKCVLGIAVVMRADWQESKCFDFLEKISQTLDEISPARALTVSKELYRLD